MLQMIGLEAYNTFGWRIIRDADCIEPALPWVSAAFTPVRKRLKAHKEDMPWYTTGFE